MSILISYLLPILLIVFAVKLCLLRRGAQGQAKHDALFYGIASRFFGCAGVVLFLINIVAYCCGVWTTDKQEFVVVTFILLPLVFGGLTTVSIVTAKAARKEEEAQRDLGEKGGGADGK